MDYGALLLFSLIAMRMVGFFIINPLFGRNNIPQNIKMLVAMLFTFVVYSYSSGTTLQFTVETPVEYAVFLLKEFIIGYAVSLVIYMFLYIISFAGDFLDMQMGLSMAKVYDPQSHTSVSVSGTIYTTLFIMMFFVLDGHLTLLRLLLTSGELVGYGSVAITHTLTDTMLRIFTDCTILGLKLSFPIFAAEFLGEIGVGILMKTIPQINVFVVNIQAKVVIGLALMVAFFFPMASFLENVIYSMIKEISNILTLMR